MFTLITIVLSFFVEWDGFFFTAVKPRQDMRDLGSVNITLLEVINNQWVERCQDATIAEYVVWLQPRREPMYLIYAQGQRITLMAEIERLPQMECNNPSTP